MSKLDLFHSELIIDYLSEGLSMRALVKKYGVHSKYINAHLKRHNIPKRGSRPHIQPHIQDKLNDREWLLTSYNESRSSQKIADVLGVTKQCVLKYMKKAGINPKGNQFYFGGKSGDIEELKKPDYMDNTAQYESTSGYEFKRGPKHPKLKDRDWLLNSYKECMNAGVLSDQLRVNRQTVLNALHYHNIPIVKCGNTSNNETLLLNLLTHLNPIQSHKLDNIELDLFFPDYNLAVEIHGLRFHSEMSGGKSRQYHQNKYEVCKSHGIHLYQFWDHEVSQNTDLVCNMIRSKCGDVKKLNARDYTVSHGDDVRVFLNSNHIQGSTNYTHSISLKSDIETIAVMTFIKPRNRQYDWELNRYCVKAGFNVRGAFSRLLKYGPAGTIVSYSDCRYSDGNVYQINGFKRIRTNDPIYYYTCNYKTIENRMGYQKSKIAEKFPDQYDSSLTEWQNMQNLGYDRVWACKTYTWIKTI